MGRGRGVSDTMSLRWMYGGGSMEGFDKSPIRGTSGD